MYNGYCISLPDQTRPDQTRPRPRPLKLQTPIPESSSSPALPNPTLRLPSPHPPSLLSFPSQLPARNLPSHPIQYPQEFHQITPSSHNKQSRQSQSENQNTTSHHIQLTHDTPKEIRTINVNINIVFRINLNTPLIIQSSLPQFQNG
ncbi:uncharacterized protein EAF01_005222 [Botrytis porri]|uniref:uncharacterized protein n=1 Tax=Botrytis porri TaxID=87229 RepID=UPI0018FF9050|nr:uncharacterized protein EAF01_005222 [Botrytis porri]KAF7907636.1 hypothetical protein EAF01_005222 [Botrytis porri]